MPETESGHSSLIHRVPSADAIPANLDTNKSFQRCVSGELEATYLDDDAGVPVKACMDNGAYVCCLPKKSRRSRPTILRPHSKDDCCSQHGGDHAVFDVTAALTSLLPKRPSKHDQKTLPTKTKSRRETAQGNTRRNTDKQA